MALSHQWFIQWSSPPSLLADINTQFGSVNNWKSSKPDWAWEVTLQKSDNNYKKQYLHHDKHNTEDIDNAIEKARSFKANEASRLTLWLTMLGVARAQAVPADIETPPFNTLYKWKYIDFEFPSLQQRKYAIATGSSGQGVCNTTVVSDFHNTSVLATYFGIGANGAIKYIPENVLPLGLEVWGSRVWVTFPSWRPGVPATLTTVSRDGGLTSPPLKPYPDWAYHDNENNCSGLTSVFRVNADPCGRLWVIDSGQINSQDQPKQKCPPSIVLFDLHTDTMINRYIIPSKYVLQDSLYSNIIVDTRRADCSDLHVYIADTWRFGLLVFREKDAKFWRYTHPLFYPDPLASNYTVHGVNFQWPDGIFGLSLSPIIPYEERVLFFHSLSSYREFYVLTKVLQDPSKINSSASDFNLVGDSRGLRGQASASGVDRSGVMYYGLVSQDSIGCWDTRKPYKKHAIGIVATDSETLVFPNDLKVDQDQQQSIWVLSNKLPLFQARRLNPNDYNYRILYADTTEAVRGTICDPEVHLLF